MLRQVTFDELSVPLGRVTAIVRDGVTVSFPRAVDVVTAPVATASGTRCLANTSQDPEDETGFQKPLVIDFDQLQRAVTVAVGLAERDISVPSVTANLRAYETAGRQVAFASRDLGQGPAAITSDLHVDAGSEVIARVLVEYSGNGREYIDDLRFEADVSVPPPRDSTPPVVHIDAPFDGQVLNGSRFLVRGRVQELTGIRLAINGERVAPWRDGLDAWRFSTAITLTDPSGLVRAEATDDAGNTGADHVTVRVVPPASVAVSGVALTQSGLFDAAAPIPARLVAAKTTLLRATLAIRTLAGDPAAVDGTDVVVEGSDGSSRIIVGQPRMPTTTSFSWTSAATPVWNGQSVYFFIPGSMLRAGVTYTFRLRAVVGGTILHEESLATGLRFRAVGAMTFLLVPQQHELTYPVFRGLMNVLRHTARMYPVPDGTADLGGDDPAGVRFAIVASTDYAGHTDPGDDSRIAYEQGFLLHDHYVSSSPGPDGRWGTADDDLNKVMAASEYLCINFTSPEDENRDRTISGSELTHVQMDSSGTSPAGRRFANWSAWVRAAAESRRTDWNRTHAAAPWRQAFRSIALPTGEFSSGNAQNRTGLAGNAGAGETSYWADIGDTGIAFLAHETGHTLGMAHKDDCVAAAEGVDLITGSISTPAGALMCPGVGGSAGLFLVPSDYDSAFDQLVGRTLGPGAGEPIEAPEVIGYGVHVMALIERDGDGTILFVEPGMPVGTNDQPVPSDGEYGVALVDANREIIAEAPLVAIFQGLCLPLELSTTIATGVVAVEQDTSIVAIEIRRVGKAIGRLERGDGPAIEGVTASLVRDGEAFNRLTVAWEKGNGIGYVISYTFDGGKTYHPLAGPVSSPPVEIPIGVLPGGEIRVRVRASDGFATAEATSQAIELPATQPIVAILEPEQSRTFREGEPITCVGTGFDPGRGMLRPKALHWFVDGLQGVRPVGRGAEVVCDPLPPGQYTFTLVGAGVSGEAADKAVVTVLPAEPPLLRPAGRLPIRLPRLTVSVPPIIPSHRSP